MSFRAHFRKRDSANIDRMTRDLAARATRSEGTKQNDIDRSPIVRRAERHSRTEMSLGDGVTLSPDAWQGDYDG